MCPEGRRNSKGCANEEPALRLTCAPRGGAAQESSAPKSHHRERCVAQRGAAIQNVRRGSASTVKAVLPEESSQCRTYTPESKCCKRSVARRSDTIQQVGPGRADAVKDARPQNSDAMQRVRLGQSHLCERCAAQRRYTRRRATSVKDALVREAAQCRTKSHRRERCAGRRGGAMQKVRPQKGHRCERCAGQ